MFGRTEIVVAYKMHLFNKIGQEPTAGTLAESNGLSPYRTRAALRKLHDARMVSYREVEHRPGVMKHCWYLHPQYAEYVKELHNGQF